MHFADDMVIFGKNIEDLQNSLNILKSYCDKWGLEVNTSKTKVMFFRNRGPLRNNEVWFYAGNKLDVVDNFNYLRTVFNYTYIVLNQQTLLFKT